MLNQPKLRKQRKTTMLMYKNISSFFVPFITQNVWMRKIQKVDGWASHTGYESSVNPFYSRSHLLSLLLTRCMWSRFLLAHHTMQILVVTPPTVTYTMHVINFPSSILPRNSHAISVENTCILFIWGTRCISCYFHQTKVRLNFLRFKELRFICYWKNFIRESVPRFGSSLEEVICVELTSRTINSLIKLFFFFCCFFWGGDFSLFLSYIHH